MVVSIFCINFQHENAFYNVKIKLINRSLAKMNVSSSCLTDCFETLPHSPSRWQQ